MDDDTPTADPTADPTASDGPVALTPSWRALAAHAEGSRDRTLTEMFSADPHRLASLAVAPVILPDGEVRVDISKQRITAETLDLLLACARERGLPERTAAMFRGDHLNTTEDRAVLHVALRMPADASLVVDGVDVVVEVHDVLRRMAAFADQIRTRRWFGASGKPVTSIVNIGIGGSDLGPRMADQALRAYADHGLTMRFVSNIDGSDLVEATRDLDPATTLFIVSSKTFTTQETLTNALSAREWIRAGLGGDVDVSRHFVAVSTNSEAVLEFGIDTEAMFGFWDWVGGRYSLDSAIGLSTMVAIGPDNFAAMLAGMHAVDVHFRDTTLRDNLPVLVGLLQVWNRDMLGIATQAVLPYDQYLALFPTYLQQLTMESNGKSVTRDGSPVGVETSAVWWGAPGTNGQHSFYQLIHQGTQVIASDIIWPRESLNPIGDHHPKLIANAIAQARVLAFGRSAEELRNAGTPEDLVAPRTMPGNRPSTTLVLDKVTPASVGALVALYEHATFVAGIIWGIDSFDQWGVELGKATAASLLPALTGGAHEPSDPSTEALIALFRS